MSRSQKSKPYKFPLPQLGERVRPVLSPSTSLRVNSVEGVRGVINMDLSNKVVFITGITGTLGQAIAESCVDAGAKVYGTFFSRVKEAGDLQKQGMGVFQVDHRKPEEVQQKSEQILKQLGRIDVLINNAGMTLDRMSYKMEPSEWNEVMSVNLTAPFLWTKAALKMMMKQRSGKIVMVASRVGIKGAIGAANYAASKAALIGLVKSIAKEMGRYEILANVVCPGLMKSRMTEILPEVCWENAIRESALGKHGDTNETAKFITYLISDEARSVTGQVFQWDSRV